MTTAPSDEPTREKPLRLWPGVVAVALQWLVWFVMPLVVPGAGGTALLGGVAFGLAVVVWWLFFSRAPWVDRVGALVLMAGGLLATRYLVHPSFAEGGMGMMLPLFATPLLSLALVASAVASRRLPSGQRRASMLAAILLACSGMTLIRSGGVTGDSDLDLHWRWTRTPEELLLAKAGDEPLAPSPAPPVLETHVERLKDPAGVEPLVPAPAPAAAAAPRRTGAAPTADVATAPSAEPVGATTSAHWPGFRGPARDGVVRGVRIETDWARKPPVELWRRAIGPGWSSFAVHGELAYTQEQRGDDEILSCYRLHTGEPVWRHRDRVRHWDSEGGAGPRATPAVGDGRVYALGATGLLNALDARDGSLVWSRNPANDTGTEAPHWGFAGSPLLIDDLVIVAVSGRLAAYEIGTGRPRWVGPPEGGGYSSPHSLTIDGVAQVLLLRGRRTTSVAPADGAVLWEHSGEPAVSMVQPAQAANGDVLIVAGDAMGGTGMRRIAVAHAASGWTVEERWTSLGLKPWFNDIVVHAGHAFGFDGSIMACIDLEDGRRKWKGGRYGHGQLVLLADQDLLLVLSEEGELALVRATPDQFTELARWKAVEGKTWNHPVLVGDFLLVRNGEEMAAFRLPRANP
jgi:outer membrane protein assembly factor BamB